MHTIDAYLTSNTEHHPPIYHSTHLVLVRGEGGGGSIKIELVSDADFCHQLLVDGFVQSYVDFYHLTHRADPNQGEGSTAKISTPFEDMVLLRDNLTAAENCRRSGNTSGVYKAYTALTDVYVKKSDWKTAIFFQEKCLEVAQLTSDKKAELDAIHSLGCVYQRMSDFSAARTLHERQEDLASMQDDTKEVVHCTPLYLLTASSRSGCL